MTANTQPATTGMHGYMESSMLSLTPDCPTTYSATTGLQTGTGTLNEIYWQPQSGREVWCMVWQSLDEWMTR